MKILLAFLSLLLIGSFGCGMSFWGRGDPDYLSSVAAAMRGDSHYREREAARKRALETGTPQAWAELEYWERKERERKEEEFRHRVLDEMNRRKQTGTNCYSYVNGNRVETRCY